MRALLIAAALLAAMPAQAETLAIMHAKAWTMTAETPIDDATIIVTNGRIATVTPHGAPPAGAKLIDAQGRIVTPGLMDGATQLGLVEIGAAEETGDQSASAGPLGAAFDVHYALNPASALIPVARADGLTRAMTYPGGAGNMPFAGMGALIRLDGELIERPRAAMFATVGISGFANVGGSRAAVWGLIRDALDEARAYAARPRSLGPRDQILDHPDIEALAPVIAGTMPLVIEAERESDIREAIRLGTDYRLRIIILGGAEAWRAGDALAAAHVPVILDPIANLPQSFDMLGARLDNAALLAKAGVTIAFSVPGNGIDLSYNAGLALREGAGTAVANGLPYAAALRAITAAPARIWGIADHYGTLAPGADADIVLWDGDPLEPASAPVALWVKGKAMTLVTRQTLLRDRYAPGRANDPLPAAYR
jgi:imidazolonepropionase-like amidohydrolase